MDLVKKALDTNGCKILELAEPDFNPAIIGKKIDALNKEIDLMRRNAWTSEIYPHIHGNRTLSKKSIGVDIKVLRSKIAIRDSLICHLKSLKLLNE